MDELVDFLTDSTLFTFTFLTPCEWRGQDQPRVVSMESMGAILEGVKDKQDTRTKLACFPKHLFVYTDDLDNAFHVTCNKALYDRYEGSCPYQLDWNPSTHPYEDLIAECPDFSPSPSGREQRRQTTAARNRSLREKADEMRAQNPGKSEVWVARRLLTSGQAIGLEEETVRKIIRK